jgi:PKHD-type hydroxylase|tara:strand:+ start:1942 stop:2577 length:636 start_codon:yes stop_codon:yes gene_type:complete
MNLSNYYWHFESALTPKFCDDVIKYGLERTSKLGTVGNYKEVELLSKDEITNMKIKRDSDITWLQDPWIYKEIQPYIHKANKNAGWNFEWDMSEPCQFTKYKPGQYYDWHCDSWDKVYDNPNLPEHGKIRKLSVTCQLTDGAEYEGGELEFDFRNYVPHMREETKHLIQAKEILPKGSIIVFPSFLWHRVKPVIKGTRYSLVLWNLGRQFK